MKTKIVVSLYHNDHTVWSAWRDIDPALARLMTETELNVLAAEAEDSLRRLVAKPASNERDLTEERPKKKKS